MNWTRRLFLRESLRGWLGLVAGPIIYASARLVAGSRGSAGTQPKDIGAARSLEHGKSKTVNFGNTRVLVARDPTGRIHAVSAICTHMGCSIRMEVDQLEGHLACNCHDSRFNLRGENLSGPATRPLAEYRIENIEGRLMLSSPDGSSLGR